MLKSITLISVFILSLFLINSCVEEPTIAPVKTPFTMVRFGNMVSNVENVDVLVDGTVMATDLGQDQFTDFVQITSGKRAFVLRNSATDEIMFQKNVDATSYDEVSFYFAGYYSASIDTNAMGLFSYFEGATYHLDQPSDGKAQIYFIHGSGDTPTDSTRKLDVWAEYTAPGDTMAIDTLLTPQIYCEGPAPCGDLTVGSKLSSVFLEYGDVFGVSQDPGNFDFRFTLVDLDGDETDSVMATISLNVSEGTRNYIYLSGPSSNIMVASETRMPLAVQDK